jgi:dUTP pyrophosphatase
MAKCGIHVIAGVIDADYRGEILVMLQSLVDYDIEIVKQTRIAQALVHKVANFDVVEVEELSATIRGAGGFGSTGK